MGKLGKVEATRNHPNAESTNMRYVVYMVDIERLLPQASEGRSGW